MKRLLLLTSLAMVTLLSACQKDNETSNNELDQQLERTLESIAGKQGLDYFTLPASNELSKIPQDPKNPLTREKVELGALLYHETGLALSPMRGVGEGTYSCASCHFASAGFQAGRVQGIGEGGIGFGIQGEGRDKAAAYRNEEIDVQPIRTPTALNVAYQRVMLWNGQFGATGPNAGTEASWTAGTPKETNVLGYQGVETQAIAGLDVHRLKIDPDFLKSAGYDKLFEAAFPALTEEERYTAEMAGLAIAAYERTLLANQSPFQRWLRGDMSAMSPLEKEGAIFFFGKAACANCHTGPALSSETFYGYGMGDLFECPEEIFNTTINSVENKGRGGFTGRQNDMFKFKTPQLYNISDSPFYGHGSSFRSIRDVVAYKNEAIPQNPRVPEEALAGDFSPLNLSNSEIEAITAFLETGLRDPELSRYEPSALLSGQCFPNNDNQSKADLNCN